MRLSTVLAVLAVALFLPKLLIAQQIELEPALLPEDEFVPTVTEDHQGNIWVGTREGVVRYEGEEATVFAHDSLDASSLAYNYIEELYVTSDGTLWVGTYGGGLDRFDPETETFTHFAHDPNDPNSISHENVTVLLEDSDGVLWVGTREGLNRFNEEEGTFTRFANDPNDPTSLPNNWLRALLEDSQGRFWIGSQGGLILFDRDTGTSVAYQHDPDDVSSLIDDRVSTILEDSQGRLWVGTGRPEGGLNLMDPALGSVTRFAYDPDDPNWPAQPAPEGPFDLGGVTALEEDSEGNIWIGSWEGWVTSFDPETKTGTNYDFRTLSPPETDEIRLFDIFEASDGTMWFGSVYGPLYKGAKQ
jgi:ligand-binding sensor domain-containing protein